MHDWISVQDRVPDCSSSTTRYLVVWESCEEPSQTRMVDVAYCYRGTWIVPLPDDIYSDLVITYWMPFPELPKD